MNRDLNEVTYQTCRRILYRGIVAFPASATAQRIEDAYHLLYTYHNSFTQSTANAVMKLYCQVIASGRQTNVLHVAAIYCLAYQRFKPAGLRKHLLPYTLYKVDSMPMSLV